MRPTVRQRLITELVLVLAALAVVAVDQISKSLVRSNMSIGQSIPEEGFLRITYVTNTGGVFGILANQAFLITVVAIVSIAAILIYVSRSPFKRMPATVALGVLLGGTVGNLVDRLTQGAVTDFIDIGVGHYRWPMFNVADSAIVVSVIVLICFLLFGLRRQEPVDGESGQEA